MKSRWPLLLALPLLAAPARLPAQCRLAGPTAGASAASVKATLGRIEIASVSADHVQISVGLSMVADRKGVVSQITFSNLHLNGMPLYAAPATLAVELEPGQMAALPAPLALNIYYRDLDSVQPLLELLRSGSAHVEGRLDLEVELNLAEKMALGAGHAHVVADFANDVPVSFPGGVAVHAAALAALSSAAPLLQRAQNGAASALTAASRQRRDLEAGYGPSLLLVRTQFSLAGPKGEAAGYECMSSGFQIGGGQFIVLKQAVQPWEFDGAIALRMKRERLRIPDGSYDVTVWRAGARWLDGSGAPDPSVGWSEAAHQIRLVRLAKDDSGMVFVPGENGAPAAVQLHRQLSAGNLALMQFTASAAASASAPREDARGAPAAGEQLATFRFAEAAAGGPAVADPLWTKVTVASGVLELAAPVDASGWGAPLISASATGGIVGVVQTDTAGLDWGTVRRALALPSSIVP